jgi:hypothetical protein
MVAVFVSALASLQGWGYEERRVRHEQAGKVHSLFDL